MLSEGIHSLVDTGILYFDGMASVIIGLILVGTAAWLAYETKGLLIGESANQHVVKDIRTILQSSPHIGSVNEILTMHMGPDYVLANLSVDFNDTLTTGELEGTIPRLDKAIKEKHSQIKRIFIEAEKIGSANSGRSSH